MQIIKHQRNLLMCPHFCCMLIRKGKGFETSFICINVSHHNHMINVGGNTGSSKYRLVRYHQDIHIIVCFKTHVSKSKFSTSHNLIHSSGQILDLPILFLMHELPSLVASHYSLWYSSSVILTFKDATFISMIQDTCFLVFW